MLSNTTQKRQQVCQGRQCSLPFSMREILLIVALGCFCCFRKVAARDIRINPWTIPADGVPYPTRRVHIGDAISWHWTIPGLNAADQPLHTVNYHPTGTCSQDGRIAISENSTGPAGYTFTEEDFGKNMLFACDIGSHCNEGMRILVEVLGAPTISPTPTISIPIASPTFSTDRPTDHPTPSPSQAPTLPVTITGPSPEPPGSLDMDGNETLSPEDLISVLNDTLAPSEADTDPSSPLNENRTLAPTDSPTDTLSDMNENMTLAPTEGPTTLISDDELASKFTNTSVSVSVSYTILIPNGTSSAITKTEYQSFLVAAMDILALEVAEELFDRDEASITVKVDRSAGNGRRMQLMGSTISFTTIYVEVPTQIDRMDTLGFTSVPQLSSDGVFMQGPCPLAIGHPTRDRCEGVLATILLVLEGAEEEAGEDQKDVIRVEDAFEDGLNEAVFVQGRFDELMRDEFSGANVMIVSGTEIPASDPGVPVDSLEASEEDPTRSPPNGSQSSDTQEKLSAGEITGAVAALFFALVLVLLMMLLAYRRKQNLRQQRQRQPEQLEEMSIAMDQESAMTGLEWGSWYGDSVVSGRKGSVNYMLDDGQSQDTNDSKSRRSDAASSISSFWSAPARHFLDLFQGQMATSYEDPQNEDSSSGREKKNRSDLSEDDDSSVGWNSVSMASGSVASSTVATEAIMKGARVVDFGARNSSTRIGPPAVKNFGALEAAILAGDWEALAANASNLASSGTEHTSGDKGDNMTTSKAPRSTMSSWENDEYSTSNQSEGALNAWQEVIDAGKAAELENLIQEGNWEGIIEAAARYNLEKDGRNDEQSYQDSEEV